MLGGRLVRSGVIYWSQCVEGLIVIGVVCVLLLILRDQLVVSGLGLICPVAASGHNYLALVRQGGLNPLTTKAQLASASTIWPAQPDLGQWM